MEQLPKKAFIPGTQAYSDRVVRETDSHFPEQFSSGLDTLCDLGFIEAEDKPGLAEAFDQVHVMCQTVLDAGNPEALVQITGNNMIEPAMFHSTQEAIAAARVFIITANQLINEMNTQESVDAMPLFDALNDQQQVPLEMALRWTTIGSNVLTASETILTAMSVTIAQGIPNQQPPDNLNLRKLLTVDHTFDRIPGADKLVNVLRRPSVRISEELTDGTIALFMQTYRAWREARRLVTHYIPLPDVEVGVASEEHPTTPDPTIAEIAAITHAELTDLIGMHTQTTQRFRPSWKQLQAAGLRPFYTSVVHESRTGRNELANWDVDGKRLTGVLRSLSQLAANPEAMTHTFTELLAQEYILEPPITHAQEALKTSKLPLEIPPWHSVTKDIDSLQQQWPALQPHLEAHWPAQGDKPGSVQNIAKALQEYKELRYEQDHPEQRLEKVARSLGVVAMPAETRVQTRASIRESQQRLAKDTLRTIAHDERQADYTRQRAEIILHFMDLASNQRQAGDEEELGDLFVTERDPRSGKRYFCLLFRAPDTKEWALLESLSHETATFAIPMDVVRQYGTLSEFIGGFNKQDQRDLGSHQVIHSTGWTVGAHSARIMEKVTAR